MEFEVGDVVNSTCYSDNSSDDYKIIKILGDTWGTKKYVLESLVNGTRCERASYQINHSKRSMKWMNSVCDCGAKKIRHAMHVHWCKSQQTDVEKELKYL